ncbi:expressed unknown protein [Seminavis robusta]|uniref:Uncharacterized protein n=1 Tax=Seminavis robusta TaxID=568900 RepID=A0A9N8E0C9_9STRA|nr:expressed unknown protein [Seminavis robusta]|eukprot:Sro523_g159820.1 n/a (146) ;mRNA; r:47019-47456
MLYGIYKPSLGDTYFHPPRFPKTNSWPRQQRRDSKKCSIAAISDIGKEGTVQYAMRLKQQIDTYLGYPAITDVHYNAKSNPNHISIDFVNYKTINAERIELCCDGRESQLQIDSSKWTRCLCALAISWTSHFRRWQRGGHSTTSQ